MVFIVFFIFIKKKIIYKIKYINIVIKKNFKLKNENLKCKIRKFE